MSSEALVLFERLTPQIALVTLNRPAQLNSVNVEMANSLREIVRETEADEAIRVVILSATGEKAFCTGADLSEIANGRALEIGTEHEGFAAFAYVTRRKPWIAAVRGMAYGGGFELALACEMIVAGDGARFALTEVRWGLMAASGGAYRLVKRLPYVLAMEMLCTADPMPAEMALSHGLVNRVVASDQVLSTSIELARRVARNAPLAVAASVSMAQSAAGDHAQELRNELHQAALRLSKTADAQEGPRAFIERREPSWQGR